MIEALVTIVVIAACIAALAGTYYLARWVRWIAQSKLTSEQLEIAGMWVDAITDELAWWMKLLGFLEAANIQSQMRILINEGWSYRKDLSDINRGQTEARALISEVSDWIESSKAARKNLAEDRLVSALETETLPDPTVEEIQAWLEKGSLPTRWQEDLNIEWAGNQWRPKQDTSVNQS